MQKGNGWNKRMMMVHTLKSRELLDHQGVKRRKGGEKPFHTKIQPWFQEGCCIDENGRWHRCDVAGNHNTECHPAYIDQSDKCKHTLLAYHIITGVVFFWSHLYSHLYFVWKRATYSIYRGDVCGGACCIQDFIFRLPSCNIMYFDWQTKFQKCWDDV